jgi:chromosome segregation ATPase
MRRISVFGLLILALFCTSCGADKEKAATRQEIASLKNSLENLQAQLDQRDEDLAKLRQLLEDKEPRFIKSQEQLLALEKKFIASEETTLDKISELEEKLKNSQDSLATTKEQLEKQKSRISILDEEHDDVDKILAKKSETLTQEVAAKKKDIKDIRRELSLLKAAVEKQASQLASLQQSQEMDESGAME